MIRLDITCNDIDSIIAAGYDRVRVYSATASRATDFTTLEGSAALSANVQGYTYVDTDGSSSNYYKTAYYGTTPGESDQSPTSGLQGSSVQSHYCTALEVRQELTAGAKDDAAASVADDTVIWRIIDAVSRNIDSIKRVEPGAFIADTSTSARYFFGSGEDWQRIDYCTSIDAVEVEETDGTYTAWTENTDFYTLPYNASTIGEPVRSLVMTHKTGTTKGVWVLGPRRIKVAAYWGISSTVPPAIKQAAIAMSTRIYKSAQQGYQDMGATMEFGQLMFAASEHPQIKLLLSGAFPHTRAGI